MQVMHPLRRPSVRPGLVVDRHGYRLHEWVDGTYVGRPHPFGRERCLYALPLNATPAQWLEPHTVVHDHDMCYLADPQGNLIGKSGVWVPRMMTARWSEDTRRIAG
jgi:hypothetical protein